MNTISKNPNKSTLAARKWRAENPEKAKEATRRWNRNNPEKTKEKSKTWRRKNRERCLAYERMRIYGLSSDKFLAMLLDQKGKCAICGFLFSPTLGDGNKTPCVDHDHITGKVRGLLCTACNKGIGALKDSIELLESAAYYLQKNS